MRRFAGDISANEYLAYTTDHRSLPAWLGNDTVIGLDACINQSASTNRVGLFVHNRTKNQRAPPQIAPLGQRASDQHGRCNTGFHIERSKPIEAIAIAPPLPWIATPALRCQHSIDMAVEQQGWARAIFEPHQHIWTITLGWHEFRLESIALKPCSNNPLYRPFFTRVTALCN